MIKIILSIAVVAMVFSGCVGTLVQNERGTKSNTRVTKGLQERPNTVTDKKRVIKKPNLLK